MSGKSRKIAVCGLLGALALVLTLLEGMLPPIPGLPPGARPGLSNIVTMFAAGSLGLPYALAIALIKGVFAFLTRGVTAGLMSLSGGLMSTLAMWAVWKKTRFSLLFTGVCGALAHNAAQLCIAVSSPAAPRCSISPRCCCSPSSAASAPALCCACSCRCSKNCI